MASIAEVLSFDVLILVVGFYELELALSERTKRLAELCTVNKLFNEIATPRLYRKILAAHLDHPSLRQTLESRLQYLSLVEVIQWSPALTIIYTPDLENRWLPAQYSPTQFVADLEPVVNILRKLPTLNHLFLGPLKSNMVTAKELSPNAAETPHVDFSHRPTFTQVLVLPELRSVTVMLGDAAAPAWSILNWLLPQSQPTKLNFLSTPECSMTPEDAKWTSVSALSLSLAQESYSYEATRPVLSLCTSLRSLNFDFGESETVIVFRGCGTHRMRNPDGESRLQRYVKTISRHPNAQDLTTLSFSNMDVEPDRDSRLALHGDLFPACTHLHLHFAFPREKAYRTNLKTALEKLLAGTHRPSLESLTIRLTFNFHAVFTASTLPCAAISLFKRIAFPQLNRIRIEANLGSLVHTAGVLEVVSGSEEDQIGWIEQELMDDLNDFVMDADEDLDIEVRYNASVAEYGKECFVLSRKAGGLATIIC